MTKTQKYIADALFLAGNIAGSTLIAMNIGLNFYGYLAFIAGSLAGTYLLLNSNASKSILLITLYFFVINVVGVVRYA